MSSIEDIRRRVNQIGKVATITEEMIRLGFITSADIASGKLNEAEIKAVIDELQPTLAELNQIQVQLNAMGDLESLLKEIRAERILQVKQKREERIGFFTFLDFRTKALFSLFSILLILSIFNILVTSKKTTSFTFGFTGSM